MTETQTATPEPRERRASKTELVSAQAPQVDAQALIAKAIDKGAAIDTVERLVALAKDVRNMQARDAWYSAMAEFQQNCPPIKKTGTAKIQSARGQYSYTYAPLEDIMRIVTPVLTPLGLSVSWRSPKIEHGSVVVSCRVAHRMGHHEDSGDLAMPIGDDRSGNPAQRVGSALTYAKRYTLIGVLGLAPEDDDDAAGVNPNHSTPTGSTRANKRTSEEQQALADLQAAEEERNRATPVETLFPQEEEDRERQALVKDATRLASKLKLTPAQRQDFMSTYCGRGATPFNADLAAMAEMVDALRARAGEEKRRPEVEPYGQERS